MMTFRLWILHRFATHWQGGYSKADFDRVIAPLLGVPPLNKFSNMSTYELTFADEAQAKAFRKELDQRVRLLHSKANYTLKQV